MQVWETVARILIGVPLFLYVPGGVLERAFLGDAVPVRGIERFGMRVLASVLLTGWLGLLLAEAGWFSFSLLALLVAAFSLAASFIPRRQISARVADDRLGIIARHAPIGESLRMLAAPRFDTLLLGVLLVFGLLVARPFEVVRGGLDAGVYANTGAAIARTGGIVQHDAIVADIGARAAAGDTAAQQIETNVFGTQNPGRFQATRIRAAGFFAAAGSLADGLVVPQFFHLWPVWLAIGISMLGPVSGLAAAGLAGALGVLFTGLIGRRAGGSATGLLAAAFLALMTPQVWFSRMTTSEALAQALTLGGIWAMMCFADAASSRERVWWGALAGGAFGSLALTRIDFVWAVGPVSALLLYVALTRRWNRGYTALALVLGALLLHAGLHGLFVARAYVIDTALPTLQKYALTIYAAWPLLSPEQQAYTLQRNVVRMGDLQRLALEAGALLAVLVALALLWRFPAPLLRIEALARRLRRPLLGSFVLRARRRRAMGLPAAAGDPQRRDAERAAERGQLAAAARVCWRADRAADRPLLRRDRRRAQGPRRQRKALQADRADRSGQHGAAGLVSIAIGDCARHRRPVAAVVAGRPPYLAAAADSNAVLALLYHVAVRHQRCHLYLYPAALRSAGAAGVRDRRCLCHRRDRWVRPRDGAVRVGNAATAMPSGQTVWDTPPARSSGPRSRNSSGASGVSLLVWGRRVVAVGLAAMLLLFWAVTGRTVFAHVEYQGALAQIEQIARAVGPDDIVLVRGGGPSVVAVRDTNDLVVAPLTNVFGRNVLPVKGSQPGHYAGAFAEQVARWRDEGRRVWLLLSASGGDIVVPGYTAQPAESYLLSLREFQQLRDQKPKLSYINEVPWRLYELLPDSQAATATTIDADDAAAQVAGFYRSEQVEGGADRAAWTDGAAVLRLTVAANGGKVAIEAAGGLRPRSIGPAELCVDVAAEPVPYPEGGARAALPWRELGCSTLAEQGGIVERRAARNRRHAAAQAALGYLDPRRGRSRPRYAALQRRSCAGRAVLWSAREP